MLTLKFIADNKEAVLAGLAKKGFKNPDYIDEVLELDLRRRNTQSKLDQSLSELNQLSKSIGMLMKEGKKEEAESARQKTSDIKDENRGLEATLKNAEECLQDLLLPYPPNRPTSHNGPTKRPS